MSRNTKATNDEKPVRTRRGRPAKNIETVTEEDEESTEKVTIATEEENVVTVEKVKSPSPEPVKAKSPVKSPPVKSPTPEPSVPVEEVASQEPVVTESVETNSEIVECPAEATLPNEQAEQNNGSSEDVATPSAEQNVESKETPDEDNRTRSKASKEHPTGRRKHRKSSSDNIQPRSPEIVVESQRKRKNRFSSPANEPDNKCEEAESKDVSNVAEEPAKEVAPIKSKTPEPEVVKDIENAQDGDGRKSRGEKENKDKKKSDEKGASNEKKQKPVRKRKWITQKSTESKPQILAISTDSLKNLISDVKPVPLSDVKLDSSPEPEEVEIVSKSDTTNDLRDRSHRKEHRNESKQDKKHDENTTTRKISIVSDDTAKVQRPPSPPKFSSSNILFITNLVRPFTVLQLKGLLARTGKILDDGFWIDKIKSKCYVKYETEE